MFGCWIDFHTSVNHTWSRCVMTFIHCCIRFANIYWEFLHQCWWEMLIRYESVDVVFFSFNVSFWFWYKGKFWCQNHSVIFHVSDKWQNFQIVFWASNIFYFGSLIITFLKSTTFYSPVSSMKLLWPKWHLDASQRHVYFFYANSCHTPFKICSTVPHQSAMHTDYTCAKYCN